MIEVSQKAKEYMKGIADADATPGKVVFLGIRGGGCSGFQYKWEMTNEDVGGEVIDNVLIVDRIAEMFVIGCTVDYVKELGGSYLKVINPNATASCGCGESFAV